MKPQEYDKNATEGQKKDKWPGDTTCNYINIISLQNIVINQLLPLLRGLVQQLIVLGGKKRKKKSKTSTSERFMETASYQRSFMSLGELKFGGFAKKNYESRYLIVSSHESMALSVTFYFKFTANFSNAPENISICHMTVKTNKPPEL